MAASRGPRRVPAGLSAATPARLCGDRCSAPSPATPTVLAHTWQPHAPSMRSGSMSGSLTVSGLEECSLGSLAPARTAAHLPWHARQRSTHVFRRRAASLRRLLHARPWSRAPRERRSPKSALVTSACCGLRAVDAAAALLNAVFATRMQVHQAVRDRPGPRQGRASSTLARCSRHGSAVLECEVDDTLSRYVTRSYKLAHASSG